MGVDRRGEVVVVFGATGGLGLGLSRVFGRDGATLVLVDIDEVALGKAVESLRAMGISVSSMVADVSQEDEVVAVRDGVLSNHLKIDVVCNTVGVSSHDAKPIWEKSNLDWRWHLDVNLWGVINVLNVFIPTLIANDSGHLINTASSITFSSRGGYAPYDACKHAVLSLSETLHHDLKSINSNVKISLLIPGAIRSKMADSERARQRIYGDPITSDIQREDMSQYLERFGADPEVLAGILDPQIAEGKFYIFGRSEDKEYAELHLGEILEGELGSSTFARRAGPGAQSRKVNQALGDGDTSIDSK